MPAMICRVVRCAALMMVLTPALAAAEGIVLRGTAEMGLIGGSRGTGSEGGIAPLSALELRLRASRTTDDGLTFGIELDLDTHDPGPPASGTLSRVPWGQPQGR